MPVLKPIECKTLSDIVQLPFDNVELGESYWAMLNVGTITICKQQLGSPREQMLEIPRDEFEALVAWYCNGVIPEADRRKPEEETNA